MENLQCIAILLKLEQIGMVKVRLKLKQIDLNTMLLATEEYESWEWGILYWSKPRKFNRSRALTYREINDIEYEMRQKMEEYMK